MIKIRAFWVPDFAKFGNSFYSKFWHINQKKIMKQKRQLIDHWVASRGPFLRFLFHFRDKSFFMTTGATLVRYEQPSEGSASPPCFNNLLMVSIPVKDWQPSYTSFALEGRVDIFFLFANWMSPLQFEWKFENKTCKLKIIMNAFLVQLHLASTLSSPESHWVTLVT